MSSSSSSRRRIFRLSPAAMLAAIRNPFGNSRAPDRNYDTERAQAIVRLILTILVASYMAIGIFGERIPGPKGWFLFFYFVAFFFVSALVYVAIVQWPGVYRGRRAFCMALDFGSLTLSMILGSDYLAPLYAIIIWVTVGYGMRYGSRYLGAATACALVSLFLIVSFSDYWRGQPYVVAALFVTAVIVPFYAHILLSDTREAYKKATAANLAKSRFLAQASHDLRQPVHAISLFTACLRDADLGTDERQMVENIDRSLQSVARLFRSLLDVATLDSGKVSPQLEVIEISGLLDTLKAQYAESAKRAGVDLRVAPCSLRVTVDANLLTVILQNLISNALKYAPGRPVLIGCRRKGRTVSIVVQDRGCGISAPDQRRVFEEFYRVNAPGIDPEGVGLGLSIVNRMASLIGLSVRLASKVGAGTAISLDGLPVTSEPATFRGPRRILPATLLNGMRVLLIEDDHAVLAATRTLLEKWGCQVQSERGLPSLVEPCDLIIADFDLGSEITGGDCVRLIRKQLDDDVPAIVMTGHDDGRVRAILGDPDIPVLSKPVRPAELRASLLSQKLRFDELRAKPAATAPASARKQGTTH